jgi:hypothetical protein
LTHFVRRTLSGAAIILTLALTGCDFFSPPKPPLPPLLRNATTTGGSNLLCEENGFRDRMGAGSTPETASHSPEITARLRRAFPVGSNAAILRRELVAQGFEIVGCEPDPTISFATFDQTGGNGITTMSAFGIVFWKPMAPERSSG